MHGPRRVIIFCLLTAVLPTILLVIPLYLRHSVYADVTYEVAESDVLEIDDGISTVFCQGHSLRMNSSFHAFQMSATPKLSSNRKHIRLKKSMILPDDTLEYWGFYLLKGSSVILKACARYVGGRIMVVKGERNLRTCGLHEHRKEGPSQSRVSLGQVRVTFETTAQEIKPPIKILIPSTTEQPVDEQFEGENLSGESLNSNNLTVLAQFAENYINKHYERNLTMQDDTGSLISNSSLGIQSVRQLRHAKSRLLDFETRVEHFKRDQNDKIKGSKKRRKHLKRRNRKNGSGTNINANKSDVTSLGTNDGLDEAHTRQKRSTHMGRTHLLDGGMGHGGNANNLTGGENDAESSFSSFENNLMECYKGQILLNEELSPSKECKGIQELETLQAMAAFHDVSEDGYYYYIFYSDNDFIQNDIHAIFNIHKSTYQYAKHSRSCINETECTFPVSFWSDEIVIVEIPTRDGLERDGVERPDDDISHLISTCHPRMSMYIVFPVAVLFLILGCAFM